MKEGLLSQCRSRGLGPIMGVLLGAGMLLAAPLLDAKSLPAAVDAPPLSPQPVHGETLRAVYKVLNSSHYRKLPLNDELSARLLDNYLAELDPSRSYFLASDLAEFQRFQHQFDDDIKQGELNAAFFIFNRFQERRLERLNYLLAKLDEGIEQLDFSVDEALETDRSEAPWPADRQALDDLWRKRLKSAVLSLKLADEPAEDIQKTLQRRYTNQLNRAQQINSEDIFQLFANAYTGLYGPHTQYFSPRKSENFNINMSLSLEGIGAVLQIEDEYTEIVRLIPSGPADKTGQLGPADRIVGVAQGDEGEMVDVVGWRLDEVVELIRGPKETVVRLKIIPAKSKSKRTKEVRIVRNEVKLEEQAAQKHILKLDRNGDAYRVGVISIPAFYIDFAALQRGDSDYRSTTRDVEKLIRELEQEDIKGLIIDLRNNGGGSLREANELVGLFIPRGPTVQIRDSWGRIQIMSDLDPKLAYDGPLVVLVNRLSASASEIFAGAIQDYSRGLVLGGQTFGKGTVQSMQPLGHGQLKLTHAKFYRISGDSTQHKGIIPDIHFPTLLDPEEVGESALDEAMQWDQASPVRHGRSLPELNKFVDELISAHKSRTSAEPDFVYMYEQIQHLEQRREDTRMSLKESILREEREEAERWQLEAENKRRKAKGLPPVDDLSEIEVERDHQGLPKDIDRDPLLRESGEVLLDLIGLVTR